MSRFVNHKYIRHSNLIEGIDSREEDQRSLRAWIFLQQKSKLDRRTIMHLHDMVTKTQLPPRERGVCRRKLVMVGDYIPPEPYLAEMQLNNWIHDMETWHLFKAKDMHIRFEKIHPFVDGNGRVGRMLFWWHEIRKGYEPTFFDVRKKQDYYDWFKEEK